MGKEIEIIVFPCGTLFYLVIAKSLDKLWDIEKNVILKERNTLK